MWNILFVLPNISIENPAGNDWLVIAPSDDPRVAMEASTNVYAKALVDNFTTKFSESIYPSFLILDTNNKHGLNHVEPIVAFRNAIALPVIFEGHEDKILKRYSSIPIYSEYFDFYPLSLCNDGDGFMIDSLSERGWTDEYKLFKGQPTSSTANLGTLNIDSEGYIIQSLLSIWETHFIQGPVDLQTTLLFRSLEMAYHASSMPFKNKSNANDYGVGISLWVSALEILSYYQNGRASLKTVIDLLGRYNWVDTTFCSEDFEISYRRRVFNVNLIQKLYQELYNARNDFIHGNTISENRLFPFENPNSPLLIQLAPIVYKIALLAFISEFETDTKAVSSLEDHAIRSITEWNIPKILSLIEPVST